MTPSFQTRSAADQQEIELRPRVVFTRTKVQSDTQRILEIYRRSGRFAATVEPKVIQLEQNRVDLAFEIDEGPVTSIRSINLIGNRERSEEHTSELQSLMRIQYAVFCLKKTP